MIIHGYQSKTTDNRTRVSCYINKKLVYYDFPAEYANFVSAKSCYDCLMITMLPMAIKKGEDLIIKGKVSEKLYHNITRYMIPLIKTVVTNCDKNCNIIVNGLINKKINTGEAVGCGLSCGGDSLACLEDYYFDENCPSNYKLTHVTNLHSGGSNNIKQYRVRLKNVSNFVAKTSLKLLSVESNIINFCKFKHLTIHPLRTGSMAVLFENLFTKYYYSSGYSYRGCQSMKGLSACDPILIHLMSTENLEMISFGCQYTRPEKLFRVIQNPMTYSHLDVCIDGEFVEKDKRINCSKCMKCIRTLLVIEHFGALEKYNKVFKIDTYHKHKKSYFKYLKKLKDPIAIEIQELYRGKKL